MQEHFFDKIVDAVYEGEDEDTADLAKTGAGGRRILRMLSIRAALWAWNG